MQTGWQVHLTDDERSRLLPVGYWRSREQPALPDPALHVDPTWDPEERRATLAYLRSAPACMRFCGYSTCRLCGRSGPELSDEGQRTEQSARQRPGRQKRTVRRSAAMRGASKH